MANNREEAYKCLDRFLRNSLDDEAYSEYSEHLENIYKSQITQNEPQEDVAIYQSESRDGSWWDVELTEYEELKKDKFSTRILYTSTPKQAISDRWIRIEDGLPQIGSKVWVGRYGKVPAVMEAIFDGDGFVEPEHYGWTYASKFKDPTHWQPEYIPSPPTNIHKGVN